jgi:S1-C subfamily serine protease
MLPSQVKDNVEKLFGNSRLEMEGQHGYKVLSVEGGDPLDGAGLKGGDYLVSINAIPLKSQADICRAYKSFADQSVVPIEFERDGKIMRSDVKL